MVVLIDCHTDGLAHEIEPQEWIALIRLADPRVPRALRDGWRFLLEFEMDRDEASSSTGEMSPERVRAIVTFWERLANSLSPLALVIRDDHSRRWSAGVAKALGEAGGMYVPMPQIEYDRNVHQTLAAELRTMRRAARRTSVLHRIRTLLGQS